MLGLKSHNTKPPEDSSSTDLTKLLFDTFSKRIVAVEASIHDFNVKIGMIKASADRSQISDLVLLERIQKTEALLEQSLNWTKRLIEIIESDRTVRSTIVDHAPVSFEPSTRPVSIPQPVVIRPIVSPSGQPGSLSSITTPTELQVLSLLAERGAVSAPEIGRLIGRSREHTARLMKQLYQEGYVKRDQNRIPFRYSLSERIRQSFNKPAQGTEPKSQIESEPKEEAASSPPQS